MAAWIAPAVLALAAGADDPGKHVFKGAGGKALPYRLAEPEGRKDGERYPLVLFLHGAGERGDDNEKHLRRARDVFLGKEARRKFPCYVLAPQCPADRKWTDTNWQADDPKQTKDPSEQVRLLVGLLDAVLKDHPVDPKRVYVTGVSMGGSATWDLVTRYPDRFAAAVPVCGGCDPAGGGKLAGLPLWVFQGAKDEVVNARMPRQTVEAVRKAGGSPKYTEYPDRGHDIWGEAYKTPELLPWLFEQRRK